MSREVFVILMIVGAIGAAFSAYSWGRYRGQTDVIDAISDFLDADAKPSVKMLLTFLKARFK